MRLGVVVQMQAVRRSLSVGGQLLIHYGVLITPHTTAAGPKRRWTYCPVKAQLAVIWVPIGDSRYSTSTFQCSRSPNVPRGRKGVFSSLDGRRRMDIPRRTSSPPPILEKDLEDTLDDNTCASLPPPYREIGMTTIEELVRRGWNSRLFASSQSSLPSLLTPASPDARQAYGMVLRDMRRPSESPTLQDRKGLREGQFCGGKTRCAISRVTVSGSHDHTRS